MVPSQPVVDVIIPAYNEEASIALVIAEILREVVRNVIVCNNNSTDRTAEVGADAGAIVVNEPQAGYGAACLRGLRELAALPPDQQPDIVIFLDGDHSDYPEELPQLIQPILRDGYELVIGSRALGKAETGSMTPPQVFGNWLATNLIRIFYGYTFTDLGPFRAIRYPALVSLNMQDRDFGWTVEMQVRAAKAGVRCTEVPVRYRQRIGSSKISGTVRGTLLPGHKILWTIFKLI